VLLALALAAPVAAQRTTGTLQGTVSDASGAVLPGVTVTLRSEAVPGEPSTVTTETGAYRFPALPPGTYSLTFALQGFTTLQRDGIPVGVGSIVEISVQLALSTVAETVTVTGESPVVNTASTQVATNYNREWVENAPIRRFTFFDLINAAPGVSPGISTSSRSNSLGSSGNENSYQLDGTDFTAPLTGAAWPWPNTDAIEEVEVLSLGASAEYGNVQGAVFNVVTRQGSNAFHGDANFYFQHQNITGRNTTDEEDGGLPYNRDSFKDTTWQLGGPVVKDRFWFFGSYQYQEDYESQPGVQPEYPARSSAKRVFFKLNNQINDSNKLQFAYHDDYYRIPQRATSNDAPSSISVENGHNPSPNLTWTSIVSNTTYFELRASGFYGKDHGDPLEEGEPRVKPRFRDIDTGEVTGGIYVWYDGVSEKTAFSGKVSHFADSFMGASHDLKLGVQYNKGGSDYVLGYNDYIYHYGGVPAYGYTQLPFHQGGTTHGIGVFFDDTIRVGERLTLNLGLRYDYNRAGFESFAILDRQGNETGQSSAEVDNLFTWNSISPRAGFTLKLDEAGRTLLKGHYGRYYRGVMTGEYDQATPSVSQRFLFSGFYDNAGNPLGLDLAKDPSRLGVDPDYSNPYTDQFIVGVERELMKNLGLAVNYVHKRSDNYGAWIDTAGTYVPVNIVDNTGQEPTGQTLTVFRLTTPALDRFFELRTDDRMFARFNGVTIVANKRMSNNWQGTFSVVLSKSEGRIGSSLGSPLAIQSASASSSSSVFGNPGFGATPSDFINTEGRLIGDRPVVAKAQIVYNFPWGFLVGVNAQHQTGRLWSRQIRPGGLGYPFRPRINTEPNTGDRRVPDWNLVDLRIQKDFKGRGWDVAVFGDILNLGNSDAYEGVLERNAAATTYGEPSRWIYPRRLMVGAKFRF
jgi:hypothetical protein